MPSEEYQKMLDEQAEQKRRQRQITYVASQLPLGRFVVIATTLELADLYSILNPKRGTSNARHHEYGTVDYISEAGRFVMLESYRTEEEALRIAKEYREEYKTETPEFGPPVCPCNKLKMIETPEGFVCPHMGELTDKAQLEWQELNDLPEWLCKLKPKNNE